MALDPFVHGAESWCRHLPAAVERGAVVGIWTRDDAAALCRGLPHLRQLLLVDDWSFRGLPEATASAYTVDEIRDNAKARLSLWHKRCQWLEMPSVEAARKVPRNSLDFVYLDGDHEESAVGDDIEAWLPAIKAGGMIAGHDYGHPDFPGVRAAVDRRFKEIELEGTVWRKLV